MKSLTSPSWNSLGISSLAKASQQTLRGAVRVAYPGLANYSSHFIPGYATLTAPLRELTRKDNPWKWTERHDCALAQLKEALASAPVTSYFDPHKETEISVDASPVGLGAILAQVDPKSSGRHVIAYASRSLRETEQQYSQTEPEAVAVVWACEHFHLCRYRKPVTVYTDHKSLISINGNPTSQPPARIQKWTLRLQPYQLTVIYRPGDGNPADYMSRPPAKHSPTHSRQEKIAEEFVDYITSTSTPKALQLQNVAAVTKQDPTLRIGSVMSEQLVQGNQRFSHQHVDLLRVGEREGQIDSWTNIPRHPSEKQDYNSCQATAVGSRPRPRGTPRDHENQGSPARESLVCRHQQNDRGASQILPCMPSSHAREETRDTKHVSVTPIRGPTAK